MGTSTEAAFDTHAAFRDLTDAGLPEIAAQAILEVVNNAVTARVATKADLEVSREATRADIAELRTEMAGLRTELKGEMAELREEVRVGHESLRAQMHALATKLLLALVAAFAGIIGTGVALAMMLS